MKVGIQVASFSWPGGDAAAGPMVADIARTADEVGFDSIWVMDHFFQIPAVGPADEQMLESYSTLAYMAGVTSRIRLGTLVTGVVYRPPGLLAKIVTTLDVLSGGRAWLGIGAAWYEREALGLGLPFPPLGERLDRLEETLQIVTRMWAGDRSQYQGRYFELAEPINSPQALSKPHPPILIGGAGERRTLRLVAQYGDACNLIAAMGPDELTRKLDVLKQHCDAVGRDYAQIERTVLTFPDLDRQKPAELIDHCRQLAHLGFQHVIFTATSAFPTDTVRTIGREVIPELAVL